MMSWNNSELGLQGVEKFCEKTFETAQSQQKIRTLNIFNHEHVFLNIDFYMGYSPISGSKSTLGERVNYSAV